ncbi:hypothetical protein AcV5_003619 [Taiwanofungus camphoratus]|nr:hypothetical protein AcV5_003619 [Antrodia cinnamomea]KAI0958299.1 hypothetical protein AcV7_004155 [Antrodia cinnamomea]
MLRTLAKVPLRRCLHTASSSRSASVLRPTRLGAVLGASAVVTTYLAWKTLQGDAIALDSVASTSKQVPLKSQSTVSPDALTDSHSATHHEPSLESASVEPEAKPEAPEEEESSGGAFNPETGEINWDCPCLGGMAHGPCGMQFREAFSCFVFSEKEPKGIECIEKFKAMQDCFREHPDVYGEDIMNDDEDDDEGSPQPGGSPSPGGAISAQATSSSESSSGPQAEASSTPTKNKPRAAA